MHEMGIALEIIDIVKDHLPADKPAVKVERVNVQIGKLSAIVADSLRFCFDIAIQDTPVAGAKLIIEEVPVATRAPTAGPSTSRFLSAPSAAAGPSTCSPAENWTSSPLKLPNKEPN